MTSHHDNTNTTDSTEMPTTGQSVTRSSEVSVDKSLKFCFQVINIVDSKLRQETVFGLLKKVLIPLFCKEVLTFLAKLIKIQIVDQLFHGKYTASFCVCALLQQLFAGCLAQIITASFGSQVEEYLINKHIRGIRCFATYGIIIELALLILLVITFLVPTVFITQVFCLPDQEEFVQRYFAVSVGTQIISYSLFEATRILLQIESRIGSQVYLECAVSGFLILMYSLVDFLQKAKILQSEEFQLWNVVCATDVIGVAVPTVFFYLGYHKSMSLQEYHPIKVQWSFFKPFKWVAVKRIFVRFPKYMSYYLIDVFPPMFSLAAFKRLAQYSEDQYKNYQIAVTIYYIYGKLCNSMNTVLYQVMMRFYTACIGTRVHALSIKIFTVVQLLQGVFAAFWFLVIKYCNKFIFNFPDEYLYDNLSEVRFCVLRGLLEPAFSITLAYIKVTGKSGLQAYLELSSAVVAIGVMCLGLINDDTNYLYAMPMVEVTNAITGILFFILCTKKMRAVTIIKAPMMQKLLQTLQQQQEQDSSSGISDLQLKRPNRGEPSQTQPTDTTALQSKDPDDDLLPPFDPSMFPTVNEENDNPESSSDSKLLELKELPLETKTSDNEILFAKEVVMEEKSPRKVEAPFSKMQSERNTDNYDDIF